MSARKRPGKARRVSRSASGEERARRGMTTDAPPVHEPPYQCLNTACRSSDCVVARSIVEIVPSPSGPIERVKGKIVVCTKCSQPWAVTATEQYRPSLGTDMASTPPARDNGATPPVPDRRPVHPAWR